MLKQLNRNEFLFLLQGLLAVGALIGGLLASYIANWIGRKLSSVFSTLPYLIGLTVIIALKICYSSPVDYCFFFFAKCEKLFFIYKYSDALYLIKIAPIYLTNNCEILKLEKH